MDQSKIDAALADIQADKDPTRKAAKLASLCSALFRERGVELVVVGGSAIELLTDGEYTSGDIDVCTVSGKALPLRVRQELMGLLSAKGGPRSWEIAGMYVDLLGPLESFARTPFRIIEGPFGAIKIIQPEELFAERVLVANYPQLFAPARECARTFAALALQG